MIQKNRSKKRWKKQFKNWSKKTNSKTLAKNDLKTVFSKNGIKQSKQRSKNCPKHHRKNRQKSCLILNTQLTKGLNSICKVLKSNLMVQKMVQKNSPKNAPTVISGTYHFSNKIYRTRAIITSSLYIFYPLFESQKGFFKEVFSENSVLMYG